MRFLDAVEGCPVGEWRLHLFLADPEAFPHIDSADGVLGAGEPSTSIQAAFVQRRLEMIARANRLASGHPWCDHSFPVIVPDRLKRLMTCQIGIL